MHTNLLKQHLKMIKCNMSLKDKRGDELNKLEYKFNSKEELCELIDEIMTYKQFKGELILISDYFDDSIGYKIAKIIENNNYYSIKS